MVYGPNFVVHLVLKEDRYEAFHNAPLRTLPPHITALQSTLIGSCWLTYAVTLKLQLFDSGCCYMWQSRKSPDPENSSTKQRRCHSFSPSLSKPVDTSTKLWELPKVLSVITVTPTGCFLLGSILICGACISATSSGVANSHVSYLQYQWETRTIWILYNDYNH